MTTFKFFSHRKPDVLSHHLVFISSIILSFGNGGIRALWGLLLDCVNFKILMGTSFILQMAAAGAFYFIASTNELLMIIVIILTSLIAAASISLITASVYSVYGDKYGSEVLGIVYYGFAVAALAGPLIVKILDLDHSQDTTYIVIYEFGAFTALLGIIALIFIDTTPKKA